MIIVGGGILGLATALRVMQARPATRLTLIEEEPKLVQHQTGHNNGVIHSGLYYKLGSLKAINCRSGYAQLIEFCRAEDIPHEICVKIVVATAEEELPRLEELYRRGIANGMKGLRFLRPDEIKEIEPCCCGIRGLFVPEAGIVDDAAVAHRYAEKLASMGAEIVLGERVVDLRHGE